MSSRISSWLGIIGASVAIAIRQTVAVAKSAVESGSIGSDARVAFAAEPKSVDELVTSARSKEQQGDYRGILADMNRSRSIRSKHDFTTCVVLLNQR